MNSDARPARAPAIVVMVLALLAASCQSGVLGGTGAPSPTLRVGTPQPASLDPALASRPQDATVVRQLFDGLVGYDATTAAVVPNVALSWEIDPANTVFTFHLRPKSRFSDGEYVTADSFVRGLTRALTPAVYHAAGSLGPELDGIAGAGDVSSGRSATLPGVRALDPHTLQISLAAPDAEFLVRCGDVVFSPLPAAAVVAGRQPSWASFPLGNGSFRLAGAMVPGRAILLTPNLVHAGSRPKVARVALEIYNDPAASYAAWRTGALDWAAYPPDRMGDVRHRYRSSSVLRPTAGVDGLVIDLSRGPGANRLFREAVSLAIDRTTIATKVLVGGMLAATGLVPPLIPGAGGACSACSFDPARARALLVQSGVATAGVFPIAFAPGLGDDAWVAAVVADLRANLGIDAVAVPATGPGPAPGGAGVVTREMREPVPDDFLGALVATGGPENTSGYRNPALDAGLATAKAIADPGARAAAYQRAEGLALADLPIVPLFWQRGIRLGRPRDWSGLGMDTFGNPTLATVSAR